MTDYQSLNKLDGGLMYEIGGNSILSKTINIVEPVLRYKYLII